MTRLLCHIAVSMLAINGCANVPTLKYIDFYNLKGQPWKLVEMQGLKETLEKHLKSEGLEEQDFNTEKIIASLNIHARYTLTEKRVTLSVGVCNGVGAQFKIEDTVLRHHTTIIHPAGCQVSIKKEGKVVLSSAPMAIEQHYSDMAPNIQYVTLERGGYRLIFRDKNKGQLAVFEPYEAAE